MEKIKVFDARIQYGRPFLGSEPERTVAEELRMADAERAVIVSREFAWLTPQRANEIVDAQIASCPGAWGLRAMYSALNGEMEPVEVQCRTFREKRIAGFWLHPDELGVPRDPIMYRDELAECERRRIPVFFHKDYPNTYEYLLAILRDHPNLTVVLSTDEEWPTSRKLYPILKAFPNVYLCISEQVWMGAMEDMVRLFGSERLLYSSSWPNRYPGGSVMMVTAADITDADRENIFCKNMERLIGGMICD